MKIGKLYKLNRVPDDGLKWVFVCDQPYGGNRANRAIGRLLVGQPYLFLGHEPGMSAWCNILYQDRTGWVHITTDHSILEITENGG